MKFLLVLLILGMSFLSGCKQCGQFVTMGECEGQIISEGRPEPVTPPTGHQLRKIKNTNLF